MVNVDLSDVHADSEEVMHEYQIELVKEIGNDYDAVVVEKYNLGETDFRTQ